MLKTSEAFGNGMDVKKKLEGIADLLPMMKEQEKLVRDQIGQLPSISIPKDGSSPVTTPTTSASSMDIFIF